MDAEIPAGGPADTLLVSCPVCQSDAAETLGVTGAMADATTGTVILQCDDCQAVYLSPPPVPVVPSAPATQWAAWRSYERWIGALPGDAELLVADRSVGDIPAGSRRYRLIVIPQLLESTDGPAALLEHAATLLGPGGRIVVVAANTESSSFRRFGGRHWSGYRFPLARQLFGPRSVRRLVAGGPLRIRRMTSACRRHAWLESLRNWLRDWDAPAPLTFVLAGPWGLPQATAAAAEGLARIRNRASTLLVELEK